MGRAAELVGDLDEDAGAVAAVLLAARGAPVGQVLEGGQPLVDQVVVGTAVEVGHQGHAAGVVLKRGSYRPLAIASCPFGSGSETEGRPGQRWPRS